MKTALATLVAGNKVRITYDDSTVEEFTVVSFNVSSTSIEMSTPVTIRYGVNAYSSVEI